MMATEIIQAASKDVLNIKLSPDGTLKISGNNDCVKKWTPVIQTNKSEILLALKNSVFNFVEKCCVDLKISAQEIINRFLSVKDEQDITDGAISSNSLQLYIELWILAGKPHYSGKKVG